MHCTDNKQENIINMGTETTVIAVKNKVRVVQSAVCRPDSPKAPIIINDTVSNSAVILWCCTLSWPGYEEELLSWSMTTEARHIA